MLFNPDKNCLFCIKCNQEVPIKNEDDLEYENEH